MLRQAKDSHEYPISLLMGSVKRLVFLEPAALRQGKYVHCATQQFCVIFALELLTARNLGSATKGLFLGVK
jgi:hypothetical protein